MKTLVLAILLLGISWLSLRADEPVDSAKKLGYVVVQIDPMEKPVILECKPDLTIMAALGSTETKCSDPQRQARLLRAGRILIIDLKKLRGHPEEDLKLMPGDVVQLPSTFVLAGPRQP